MKFTKPKTKTAEPQSSVLAAMKALTADIAAAKRKLLARKAATTQIQTKAKP